MRSVCAFPIEIGVILTTDSLVSEEVHDDGRGFDLLAVESKGTAAGMGILSMRERAALVGLIPGRAHRLDAERSLDELAGLADAAGATVVLRLLQERPKPDPAPDEAWSRGTSLGLSTFHRSRSGSRSRWMSKRFETVISQYSSMN